VLVGRSLKEFSGVLTGVPNFNGNPANVEIVSAD
jgi:hypothetical protein